MKKYLLLLIPIILIGLSILMIMDKPKVKSFYLEDKYYTQSTFNEIDIDKLNELIKQKESFVLFIYQPLCVTSSNFEKVLKEYQNENSITINKIAYADIKNTEIGDFIKYYPSFVIYHNGKVVDYLEATEDADTKYYTSKDEFQKWFTTYIKLKENNNVNKEEPSTKEEPIEPIIDINLDNVIREDNKVNIYLFWGDGCPHCTKEKTFFSSIEKEYGKYYNLYLFEVWNNSTNADILKVFATNMKDTATGVPYTIIGNKSFKGFDESYKEAIINAITSQYQNSYDVYFDTIKKQ